jgi:tRNA nucleotidyltransferase/poly(A) polymerase
MILQVHTEKELIGIVGSLKKEIEQLLAQNKATEKKLYSMQIEIDKKPNVQIKETVIKEIEKQTSVENVIVKTDASLVPTVKKLSDRLKALEGKVPQIQIKESIIKEIEKPTIKEVTLIQTDPSVIPTLKKLSDRIKALEDKPLAKEQVIHTKETKIDISVMPMLKKLSSRVKSLEEIKPKTQIIKELTTHEIKDVSAASKKEIEDIKNSILKIKPIINNITQGVSSNDVIELIDKRVILNFINKLYGK